MIYNTKCDPLNNKINVPQLSPLPGMPGFGFNLNYKGPTLPSLEGIPEDIMKYVDMLKLALPGGAFLKHQIESLQQSISKIIASLLSYLNLFLGFYFMLLSIIELILCIIQVLCGVPNPFSLVRRLKKLKRKCIPIFISICFPLFALLALLLALISILLALIEYIIALVKRFIEQLLKNVKRLKFILQQGNSDAALAIIAKIGDLMCLFEHVFVLLGAIDTIMELIKTKWKKILKVCSAGGGDGDGVDELDQTDQAYEESCCGAICANFLSNPESQIDDPFEIWKSRVKGRLGQINYTNKVLGMPYPSLPTTIVPVRDEAIYFIDDFLDSTLTFNNIISSPSIEGIMFPFFPPSTITAYTERGKIPYFIDISFGFNPEDGHGARLITITDCIITNVILDAPMYVAGGVVIPEHNDKGFLALIGGIFIDELGRQYTLLDIMRKIVGQPGTDPNADGNSAYTYMTDVIFQLKINYNALLDYMLITIDCLPSMILEDKFLSTSMYKPLHVSLGGTGGPNGLGGPDGTGDVVKNISGVLPDGTVRVIPPGGIILPDGSIVPGPGGPYFEKIPAEEILTPEQAAEKASKGTLGGLNSDGVIDITLPDVAGALQQLENSLNSYRNDITEESTAQLETILNDILIRLQKQANTTYGQLLVASVDAYSTTKALYPETQFVTDKITVMVTPTSLDGLPLNNLVGSFGSNDTINSVLAKKFTANPTLGSISNFTYDGYGNFIADLTTNIQGDGYIDIYYDGQLIPTPIKSNNLSIIPYISEAPLPYTFIGFSGANSTYYDGMLPGVRRDETDTSNSGN